MRISRERAAGTLAAMALLAVLAACGGNEKKAAETQRPTPPEVDVAPPGSTAPSVPEDLAPAPGRPPAGATFAMLAEGDSIFHGRADGGLCFTCHGLDAKGGPLAPVLADSNKKWLTGDGSYAFIQKRVTDGMPTPTAPYESPMLPKGGANLTADQVKAVAAYVYSISHH